MLENIKLNSSRQEKKMAETILILWVESDQNNLNYSYIALLAFAKFVNLGQYEELKKLTFNLKHRILNFELKGFISFLNAIFSLNHPCFSKTLHLLLKKFLLHLKLLMIEMRAQWFKI